VGVETVKNTENIKEFETPEQTTSRVSEIKNNIVRIYEEMQGYDNAVQKMEVSAADNIKRLGEYYKELHSKGEFIDETTGRTKNLNEVCRTILAEMDARSFSPYCKQWVWKSLPDDYKRAWRKPIDTIDGKPAKAGLLSIDNEVETLYDEQMECITKLRNFDYNDLPKSLRIQVAEHVYKVYRKHDKEWQKHGLTVVKHEDGLDIQDPFAGIIRVEEGEAYEGELFDALKGIKKSVTEIMKKVKTGLKDKDGNRLITLDREHEIAMGVKTLDGYFNPMANYKWKRDIPNWAKILLKKFQLKSKSGAEKFSRKDVGSNFYDFFEKQKRGVTREEIAKMEKRLCVFFLQFIKHHPGLMALSTMFEEISEEKRAAHSIKMNPKLSDRA